MMTTTTHPLARQYLRRLHRCAAVLPRRQREELVDEIRSHLEAGIPPDATEADVRNVLDQLGAPEDIVDAAAPDRPVKRRGAREVLALILVVTGFPPLIGWLIGAGLLLSSPLWSARQKLLGILVWPGGYVGVLIGVSVETIPLNETSSCSPTYHCTVSNPSPWWRAAEALIAIAPLIVAGYLYRAAGRGATR